MKPPTIALDDAFVLDGWRTDDAAAHRDFAQDAAAARFFDWTVEEARSLPDSHYVEVVRRFQREWDTGTRLSLAIRKLDTGEAVGSVELRPSGDQAEVSYFVAAEFRGRGLAPHALTALLNWTRDELPLVRHVSLNCHIDNLASQRVAEKTGFAIRERTAASSALDEICSGATAGS